MVATSLGELEKQIMDIVWLKQTCCIREVLTELKKERVIAYTTVATILQRLTDKGMVIKKEEKLGHVYLPKVSKEEYIKGLSQSFLSNLVQSFGDMAIASFAHSIDDLPKTKKEYFLEMLNQYETDTVK